jgi:hypothetical protein
MSGGILGKRPWLLVWLAFILVIIAWVWTYELAKTVPTARLNPQEEAALLRKGRL